MRERYFWTSERKQKPSLATPSDDVQSSWKRPKVNTRKVSCNLLRNHGHLAMHVTPGHCEKDDAEKTIAHLERSKRPSQAPSPRMQRENAVGVQRGKCSRMGWWRVAGVEKTGPKGTRDLCDEVHALVPSRCACDGQSPGDRAATLLRTGPLWQATHVVGWRSR